MKKIFITGTDTDVGKTVVSLLVIKYLYSQGSEPFYLKPFQTGCVDANSPDSDAAFIYKHIRQLQGADPAPSVLNCNTNPKAPWFAARDDNKTTDIESVIEAIENKSRIYDFLVIEGAGGLLVPVTEDYLMIDLIWQTQSVPVIVARTGLGTINHTLLSIDYCASKGITPAGIIMTDQPGQVTPPDQVQENIYAIEHFAKVPVFGVVGPLADFNTEIDRYFSVVENMMSTV